MTAEIVQLLERQRGRGVPRLAGPRSWAGRTRRPRRDPELARAAPRTTRRGRRHRRRPASGRAAVNGAGRDGIFSHACTLLRGSRYGRRGVVGAIATQRLQRSIRKEIPLSREVVILSAARTPVGRYLGTLAEIPASQLGAIAIVEALKRAGVDADRGRRSHHGQRAAGRPGPEPGPQGVPHRRHPARTSPRGRSTWCAAPGAKAVHVAANTIKAGDAEVIVAGGMENMSLAPYLVPKARTGLPHGRRRPSGRDDPRRPVVRHVRHPHGHHRRERGREVRHHPRGAGPDRLRQPAEGRRGHRGRQVQGRDRAGGHPAEEGRSEGLRHRRARPRPRPPSRVWPS